MPGDVTSPPAPRKATWAYTSNPARRFVASVFAGALATAMGWFILKPNQVPPANAFFSRSELVELRLTIGENEQLSLASAPRRYVPGTLHFAGRNYETALHIKGHRSRRKLGDKPAFKLQFDRYKTNGQFLGLRKLNLNNMVEDPTRMREVLSYALLEKLGLQHPRTTYARLVVNGQPQGVYLVVESLDDDFAANRFGASHGPLYEGAYGCDLYPDDVEGFDLDGGRDPDQQQLRAFVRQVHQHAENLFDPQQGPLAMDRFLTFLAFGTLVGDFDGYRHSHNYYLYQDALSKRWEFIPWGLDRTFKKHLPIYESNGLLARRCFADRTCRLQYARKLQSVTAQFEAMNLAQRVTELLGILHRAEADEERSINGQKKSAKARKQLARFLQEQPQYIQTQLHCLDATGNELDRDRDGFGCMDCDDQNPLVHPNASESCNGVDDNCSGLVDDDPVCPCERVQIEQRTYSLCTHEATWAEAKLFCEARGERLATVASPSISRALYKTSKKLDKQAWWIGYSDREREGKFRWTTGDQGDFAFWRDRQPDNGSCNQDCVVLMPKGKGRWNDTHCSQAHPFICGPR